MVPQLVILPILVAKVKSLLMFEVVPAHRVSCIKTLLMLQILSACDKLHVNYIVHIESIVFRVIPLENASRLRNCKECNHVSLELDILYIYYNSHAIK